MSDAPKEEPRPRPPEDSPAAWFVVLERARQTQDFASALRAQEELKRLGVLVKYPPATSKRKAVRHDR